MATGKQTSIRKIEREMRGSTLGAPLRDDAVPLPPVGPERDMLCAKAVGVTIGSFSTDDTAALMFFREAVKRTGDGVLSYASRDDGFDATVSILCAAHDACGGFVDATSKDLADAITTAGLVALGYAVQHGVACPDGLLLERR